MAGIMLLLFPYCKRNNMELGSKIDNAWQYTIMEIDEPVVRHSCGMAYLGGGKVIIFGGYSRNRSWPIEFQVDDLWEYDVNNPSWRQLKTPEALKPRSDVAMTYAGNGRALLYGGFSHYTITGAEYVDIQHHDTWLYDRASDSWQELVAGEETVNPGVYFGHSMTYIGNDKVLLYGGYAWSDVDTANVPISQLWEFDISSRQWTDITLGAEQSPPATPDAVFEYIGNDMVVFVGERVTISEEPPTNEFGPPVRTVSETETWIYNISSRQWTNVTERSSETPSNYGTGSYLGDASLIMYTASTGWRNSSATTWRFDANSYTWKNLTGSRSLTPPSRSGHGMTYGGEGRIILFGGDVVGLGVWNDTWEFYGGDLSNLAYQ
jgi:N-acetylneuraminic acid mutarotase